MTSHQHALRLTSWILLALPAVSVAELPDSPFLPVAAPASVSEAAATSALDNLEVSGVLLVGARVQVCLADKRSGRAFWLAVGESEAGIRAESFDAARDAVLVKSGTASRWLVLREARVKDAPVWHLPDGSVDWIHMQMTDTEKAQEANLMMWDILEVGRLKRAGKLRNRASKDAP